MLRRPWLLTLASLIHLLVPLAVLACARLLRQESPGLFLESALRLHPLLTVQLYGLSPLLGGATFVFRKWTYRAAVGLWTLLMVYDAGLGLLGRPEGIWPFILALAVFQTVMLLIYRSKSIRLLYENPKLRWWETQERFKIKIKAEIELSNGECRAAQIQDLSVGGARVKLEGAQLSGARLKLLKQGFKLSFAVLDVGVSATCTVVYERTPGDMGLKFTQLRSPDAKKLEKILTSLSVLDYQQYPPRPKWAKDLLEGFRQAVLHGEGILPEVSTEQKPEKRKASGGL